MTPELAARHLYSLDRAWSGANLCRDRLIQALAERQVDMGGIPFTDLRGFRAHDVDYYAWEAVRVVKLAIKVIKAGLRGKDDVEQALDALRSGVPYLEDFRNQVTHVEDNRGADR